MRKAPPRHSDARGFLLTELAVSLPIFVLLLTFLAFALAWSWRSYQQEVADAELRQEMHIAAVRIVESALLSDYIRQRQRGIYEMRQSTRDHEPFDRYWLSDGRLVFKTVTFPITGSFDRAGVHITSFSIREDDDHPRLYHIELTGESTVTGHRYSLATSVYLRRDMGGM
jgi:hypothetical protein